MVLDSEKENQNVVYKPGNKWLHGNGADGATASHPNEGNGADGGSGIAVIRYEV